MISPSAGKHSIVSLKTTILSSNVSIDFDVTIKKISTEKALPLYQKKAGIKNQRIKVEAGKIEYEVHEHNIGFSFEQFGETGNISESLSVIKKDNIVHISFLTLDYHTWEQYLNRILSELDVLTKYFSLNTIAIALTYTDEFDWKSADLIDISKIFNSKSDLTTKNFREALNASIRLASQTPKDDGMLEENIEIFKNNSLRKIAIEHTVAHQFGNHRASIDSIELIKSKLINSHDLNKSALNELLNEETKSLIGLK